MSYIDHTIQLKNMNPQYNSYSISLIWVSYEQLLGFMTIDKLVVYDAMLYKHWSISSSCLTIIEII